MPVILLMLLFAGIAVGLSVVVQVETTISSRFRGETNARYSAEAGVALAISELRPLPGWTPVLSGAHVSRFAAGLFRGSHAVSGGGRVTLCCGARTLADRLARDAEFSPVPARRALPWRPFVWTSLDTVFPDARPSRLFLVVSIRDDEEDGDADETTDANGVVVVRADAIDPGGTSRTVEAVIVRRGPPAAGVEIVHWRERR